MKFSWRGQGSTFCPSDRGELLRWNCKEIRTHHYNQGIIYTIAINGVLSLVHRALCVCQKTIGLRNEEIIFALN